MARSRLRKAVAGVLALVIAPLTVVSGTADAGTAAVDRYRTVTDFDPGWLFNYGDASGAGSCLLRRRRLAQAQRSARLEHRGQEPAGRPVLAVGAEHRPRRLPALGHRLVPQALLAGRGARRPQGVPRVRRRDGQRERVRQRHAHRHPPVRLHQLPLRHHGGGEVRRRRQRDRREDRHQPQPAVALLHRGRDLPRRPAHRDRPGARRPVGHPRHHAERHQLRCHGPRADHGGQQRRRGGERQRPGRAQRPGRGRAARGHHGGQDRSPPAPRPPSPTTCR